jgi:hypothetical protein
VTAPYLVACLVTLRAEFNAIAPGRDKGSDGWIGDAAHKQEVSDHNPDSAGRVLAIDIDSTGPWPLDFGALVESLRGDARLEYIIWNRRIASRDQGWTWRAYSGTSDPHTGHAHFSARHDHSGNTSTAPWGIQEMIMEPADVWNADVIPVQGKSTTWVAGGTLGQIYDDGVKTASTAAATLSQSRSNGSNLSALISAVASLTATVNDLKAKVDTLTPPASE